MGPLGLSSLSLAVRTRGISAPPVTMTFTDAQVANGYFGFFDLVTTANRRAFDRSSLLGAAVWMGYISGSSADLNCFSGDATPYIIQVDGGAEVTPTLAAGKINLFTGLSDSAHLVRIRSDNSSGGQGVPTTGALFSVTGVSPAISMPWVTCYLKDPAFPGIESFMEGAAIGGNWTPAYKRTLATASFGVSGGSIHVKVSADAVWVFTSSTDVWFSNNGGAWTRETFGAAPSIPGGWAKVWRKITGLSGSVSTPRDIIISDSPSTTTSGVIEGIMSEGVGASISAPTVSSKTFVTLFGASQVAGVGATFGSVDIDRLQIPMTTLAAGQTGASGNTLVAANAAFATWVAAMKATQRQTIILSIGINSADDASFQGDYQTLINNCLTAGFTKVVCRGLIQTSSNASKNAKIAAAVTAIGNPAVVFADVSTWTAATTDTGAPVIVMPDGSHPNDLGYDRMTTLVVRDHSALLP